MIDNIILETKLRKIETDRQIRLTSTALISEKVNLEDYPPDERIDDLSDYFQDHQFEEPEAEMLASKAVGGEEEALKKLSKTGQLGDKLATGFKQGALEFGVKKAAEKSIMYTLSKYGIKSIPLVGSLAAAISALAGGAFFLKDLYQFTQKLLSMSSVELQGATSLLGEYSIIDASASDLNRIADALEASTMSVEEATELYEAYRKPIKRFKYFLVDICFAIKEVSVGVSLGAAVAISVIPIETGFKEVLFFTSKLIQDTKAKSPRLLSIFLDLMYSLSHLVPIIGFLQDSNRIAAFSRIDDAMTRLSERDSRETAMDVASDVAFGSKRFYDIADAAGTEIAKGIGDIDFSKVMQENETLINESRWSKLAGIN